MWQFISLPDAAEEIKPFPFRVADDELLEHGEQPGMLLMLFRQSNTHTHWFLRQLSVWICLYLYVCVRPLVCEAGVEALLLSRLKQRHFGRQQRQPCQLQIDFTHYISPHIPPQPHAHTQTASSHTVSPLCGLGGGRWGQGVILRESNLIFSIMKAVESTVWTGWADKEVG